MVAAGNNRNTEIVRILLDHGAHVNYKDNDG